MWEAHRSRLVQIGVGDVASDREGLDVHNDDCPLRDLGGYGPAYGVYTTPDKRTPSI